MKIGTPHFNNRKLIEAREARGFTASAVAELTGISRQAISQFENSSATPSPLILKKIADQLNLPIKFFLDYDNEVKLSPVSFRSFESAKSIEKNQAIWKLKWLKKITNYVTRFIDLKAVNFPFWDSPISDITSLTKEEIESLANQCRQFWDLGIGPISDICLLLENNGAIISREENGHGKIDAILELSIEENRPFIILSADKNNAVRSRFDLAHELGHIILHRHLTQDEKERFHKILEQQAHYFAGAFMLPKAGFLAELYSPSLDAFLVVKEKWKISVGAMIQRSFELNIINEEQKKKLFANRARRGWTKHEPFDSSIKVEQPRFLRRSIELLIQQNIQTPEDIISNLNFSVNDIEALCNLPKTTLKTNSNVFELLPQLKDSSLKETGSAQIFPF